MTCKHLEEQEISYLDHYMRATKHAFWCMKMYVVCIAHAVFPCWFATTFSDGIKQMASELEEE
tara:strand:- start:984 stop:1172 length:189 start_codon:yes stop_codon:yes gene_type:complete